MTRSAIVWGAMCSASALAFPAHVYAYLDPGTGSILLQGLLAAVAAGSIAGKMYWRRIVGLLRGKPRAVVPSDGEHEDDATSGERDAQG